jgi:anti-sigma regulatory factor (Ser/Thr protein kinase)
MTAIGFHHEALLHDGDEGFLEAAVPFVRAGLEHGEPMLVALTAHKLGLLREQLGADADELVTFADMGEIGFNPARIIPAWQDFVDRRRMPGRGVRGIGEPIWPGRSAPQLVECHRHEALLNLAFADTRAFRLMCPYDITALAPEVVAQARCSHPIIVEDAATVESVDYAGLHAVAAPFDDPLPDPPAHALQRAFTATDLSALRQEIRALAAEAGLGSERVDDLVLAVSEIASNSVVHGGGAGLLRAWAEPGALLCDVSDAGRIEDPLAGRRRPGAARIGGYGLWVANQLCDLVQVRSHGQGSIVRLHLALA